MYPKFGKSDTPPANPGYTYDITTKAGTGTIAGTSSADRGHIYFYTCVDENSVLSLTKSITDTVQSRKRVAFDLEIPLEELPSPPIHLHIHSYGGLVYPAMAAIDALEQCPVPVHTHIEGAAASAATLISCAGKHRTIGKHSYMLIHQVSSGMWGNYEQLKDDMKNLEALMVHVRQFYKDHSKMTAKQLQDVLKHDLWFPAEKALKLGLVDEIL